MPAGRGLDSLQNFGREFLGVINDNVSLEFVRTNPHEIAEQALASGHVFVHLMSFESLDPCKALVAITTDMPMPRPVIKGTISLVLMSHV